MGDNMEDKNVYRIVDKYKVDKDLKDNTNDYTKLKERFMDSCITKPFQCEKKKPYNCTIDKDMIND